jgi:hypothetical protein
MMPYLKKWLSITPEESYIEEHIKSINYLRMFMVYIQLFRFRILILTQFVGFGQR